MAEFTYRTMRVYQMSLDINSLAFESTRVVPKRSWPIEQQLIRAAASIALNIAGGVTEFSPGEKTRFYRMALRSAGEAGSAFDILARHHVVSREIADHANVQLQGIGAMLTNLILATEARRLRARSVRSGGIAAADGPARRSPGSHPNGNAPEVAAPRSGENAKGAATPADAAASDGAHSVPHHPSP